MAFEFKIQSLGGFGMLKLNLPFEENGFMWWRLETHIISCSKSARIGQPHNGHWMQTWRIAKIPPLFSHQLGLTNLELNCRLLLISIYDNNGSTSYSKTFERQCYFSSNSQVWFKESKMNKQKYLETWSQALLNSSCCNCNCNAPPQWR